MGLDKSTRSSEESPPPIEQLLLSGSRLSQANSSLDSSQEDSMFKMSDSLLGVFSDLEPALVEPPRNRKEEMQKPLRGMAMTNPKAHESIRKNQQKIMDKKLDRVMAQQRSGPNDIQERETGDEVQAEKDERESAEDGITKMDAECDREQNNNSRGSGDYESFRDLLNPSKDGKNLEHEVEPDLIDTDKRKHVEPVTVVGYPSTGQVEAFTPLAKKPPLPPKSPMGKDAVLPIKLPLLPRKPSQVSAASVQSSKSCKSNKSKSSRASRKIAKSDSAASKTSFKSVASRKSHKAEAQEAEPASIKMTVSATSKTSKVEPVNVQISPQLEQSASTSSKACIHSAANLEKLVAADKKKTESAQPIEETKSIASDSFVSSIFHEPSVCLPPHFQRLQQAKHSEATPKNQSTSPEKNELSTKNLVESATDTITPKPQPGLEESTVPMEMMQTSTVPMETVQTSAYKVKSNLESLSDEFGKGDIKANDSTSKSIVETTSSGGRGDKKANEDAIKPTVETSASKISASGGVAMTGSKLSETASVKSTASTVNDEESAIILTTASDTQDRPVSMKRSKSSDICQSTTSTASAPAELPSFRGSPSSPCGFVEATSPIASTDFTEAVGPAISAVMEVKKEEEPVSVDAEVAESPKWKTKIHGFFNRSMKPGHRATVDPLNETAVLDTEGAGTDVDEDMQLLEDKLDRKEEIDAVAGDQDMKSNSAAFLPTPKAKSQLKSTGRGIFRRPKAASAAGKRSSGGEWPPEKLLRSPSPDRMSIETSEISLPLTSIEKKDEHFFAKARPLANGMLEEPPPVLNDDSEVQPSNESQHRVIKVDYRNTKEIEIVEIPSLSHQTEKQGKASLGVAPWERSQGKEPGKISRMMAKYVRKHFSSSKKRTMGSPEKTAASRNNDDPSEKTNSNDVKIFDDEMTSINAEKAAVAEEEIPAAELVEECFPKDPQKDETATEAMQVRDVANIVEAEMQGEQNALHGWFSKATAMLLTGCNELSCGDDFFPNEKATSQDKCVSPVPSDIEPVLSSASKPAELKTPDSKIDVCKTDPVEMHDAAENVDTEPENCGCDDPPATLAESCSKSTEIESESCAVESSKKDLAESKKKEAFKIPKSLKKSLRSRWIVKHRNAGQSSSKQGDASMQDPTMPALPSGLEIVASLEKVDHCGPALEESAMVVEPDKSVDTVTPESTQNAKIPATKTKTKLFRSRAAKWKMAKLLRSQKQRNASILADAHAAISEANASSNMEYRTVLAISDESLDEEEHNPVRDSLGGSSSSAILDAPQLTPIIEMADAERKGDSVGPGAQEPSFGSASILPRDQLIASPTGKTEGTGFESTLSILDDHSHDKNKATPVGKHRSERTQESRQMDDVSDIRGTFDDDLSNVFAPGLPGAGETRKWFW